VTAAPATAMAFGFAAPKVARALPDAWSLAEPGAVLDSRIEAVVAALDRTLGGEVRAAATELADLLTEAGAGARPDGRPLAAGWMAVAPPADPLARLWLAATVLREHRGDGHVLAAVDRGLGGLETTLTHVATGAVTREVIQPNRGWSDDDWAGALYRLGERGLLDPSGALTPSGWALREDLEAATDRLAAGPLDRLGPGNVERVIEIGAPLARRLIDEQVIPVPNPIGVGWEPRLL
jgi:hypothetical protein